jgi:site-specific DNA-cytosine methylase
MAIAANARDLLPEFCTHMAIAANARDFLIFGSKCQGHSVATVSVSVEKF